MTNSFNNEATIPAIPNGNEIVTPAIQCYVNRYNTFLKKTAESILGLAQTIIEAENDLNGVDFEILCRQIGLERNGPTHSKLKTIGQQLSRFQPFTERLPNSWTTLYKLAKLSPDNFERVSADLTPFISARAIDDIVNVKSPERETSNTDIFIDVSALDGKRCFQATLLSAS
jgi:hypothetical protein